MTLPSTLQGRPFGLTQLTEIQSLLGQYPQASRYQLSRQLATRWNWRTATGQLKDMAARTLLLKLHHQGLLQLPERRWASPTRSGRPPLRADSLALEESELASSLEPLQPLRIQEVSQRGSEERRAQLEACLECYHYLGYRSRVGQTLQYWIRTAQGRPLAAMVFGAPAWQCAVRDRWIGWSPTQRAQRLGWVLNNTRFLILPWVRVPHLASHLLGTISRRIGTDWQTKYRAPLYLLETFVDRQRFAGTVWIWNAVQDRFSQATQRLDLFHANAYLWAVAQEIHGPDSRAARQWVKPLLQQLRKDRVAQVMGTLEELKPRLNAAAAQAATKAVEYYTSNQARMKYGAGHKRGEPLGSGAIESTCRQLQCRMKRGGQFWSTAGDEALLCLEIFWRNDRWELLFPHVAITTLSRN